MCPGNQLLEGSYWTSNFIEHVLLVSMNEVSLSCMAVLGPDLWTLTLTVGLKQVGFSEFHSPKVIRFLQRGRCSKPR